MADGTLKVGTITTSSGSGTITLGQSGETVTVTNGIMSGHMYPAFEAYLSANQSINDITDTKVQFNTEFFDTDNCYDNSTNYRFTPNKAGKYFVYSVVKQDTSTGNMRHCAAYVYKNGTEILNSSTNFHSGDTTDGEGASAVLNGIIDMNGSSDYLEVYAMNDTVAGDASNINGNSTKYLTVFGAYRIGA